MAKNAYLLRRPSGIYVVRICIPARLQELYGKKEIHISTRSRRLDEAKELSFRVLTHWQQQLLQEGQRDMDLAKILKGSPPPLDKGLLPVSIAASERGLTTEQLLLEIARIAASAAIKPPLKGTERFRDMHVSELAKRFCLTKKDQWTLATKQKMSYSFGLFVELMEDPQLGEIDRELMRAYREKLSLLPYHPERVKNLHGGNTSQELIEIAKSKKLRLMTTKTLAGHCVRMSELFGWAIKEDYLDKNPAQGLVEAKEEGLSQDGRNLFSDEDLGLIFGAKWFKDGRGIPTSKGKYPHFRCHYYWIPLLGLYTGARLNELCQLHLTDVKVSEKGTPYIEFTEDAPVDLTKASTKDKSLKTRNSRRVVPIHQRLLDLGFIEYVKALKSGGHVRLFPEVGRDRVKGYAKDPGKWFNTRYLGDELKMIRDGKKTFHSFRHCFTTALHHLDTNPLVVNQLIGHERGVGENQNRYRHDKTADELIDAVNKVSFPLPHIAKFDSLAGIAALDWALLNKTTRYTKTRSAEGETEAA